VLFSLLDDSVPVDPKAQREFFSTDKETFFDSRADFIKQRAMNLRRTLVNRGGLMPIGLLQWCLEYARQSKHDASGIFAAVKAKFAGVARTDLLEDVTRIYEFRNRYVAHQDEQLTDARMARAALSEWARGCTESGSCARCRSHGSGVPRC